MKPITLLLLGVALVPLAGCDRDGAAATAPGAAASAEPAAPAVTNRIDIPEAVRQNLGITFAKVERRRVTATLRVPGRFELLPSARREYRAPLVGRVELLVKQYEAVEPGQVLARIDSPDWRRIQHEAVEAEGEIKVAEANIDVAVATLAENEAAVALLQKRVVALAEANVSRAELTTELALARGRAPRLEAQVRASRVGLNEAREHYASKLRALASVVGLTSEQLRAPATRPTAGEGGAGADAGGAGGEPLWKSIDAVEVRAAGAGVVESFGVTNGSWAEQAQLVVSTVDPQALRFRASGLQADLGRLRDGAAATVVPPQQSSGRGLAEPITGKLSVGLEASADTRTVELIVTPEKLAPWARAGISAFAEVVTDDSADPEPAIPVASVVQDELSKVYFRRDPQDPDKVIRVEGDLGVSDGRWVVVNSGLRAGDEVVLDGLYELKLTGSGKAQGGAGHFHADGTWHAAGTPEPGGK